MNNIELNLSLRVYGINRLRKVFKAINTRNGDVIYTSILKLSEHIKREVRAFIL
jgi:hypothetical protein